MRRPTSALAKAFLGAVLAGTTVSAQQSPPSTPSGGGASADAPAYSPMNPARGARHLVRNGWDYITYQEYERALAFFREAEQRQGELTEPEKTRLRQGIERAQRGLREVASGMKPERSYARSGSTTRPGAIALATPSSGAVSPAPNATPAPRIEKEPIQLAGGGAPAPNAGTVRAAIAAPAPLPAVPPESESLALPPLAAAPAEMPAPPAVPAAAPVASLPPTAEPAPISAPTDTVTPAAAPTEPPVPTTGAPAELPAPAPVPAAAPAQTPAAEPLALPAAPDSGELTLPELPSNLPAAPAELPAPAPAPATAPVASPAAEPTPAPMAEPAPIPAATAPSPAIPAELPAPELPPAASTPEPQPERVAAAVPAGVPVAAPPATTPTPEPAPATGEALPPLPQGVESESASAPVAAPSIEPPPAPPAESLPSPAGVGAETPPAPMNPAGGPAAAEASARPGGDSFLPRRHEVGPSTLPVELQREVEMIAQKQDEEMRNRAAAQPIEPTGPLPGSPASTRLEISRAPSPTEARPIRAIPVPEEFVPLPKREWNPNRKYWAAAATCHMPLYFQDASLERYGYTMEQRFGPAGRFLSIPLDDPRQSKQRNQIIQPFFSAGLFAAQIALLPYNLIMDPPWEAEYDLGYYRPGDRVPADIYYLPLTGVGPPLHGANYGKPPVANSAPRW